MHRTVLTIICCFVPLASSRAIDYQRDVKPILTAHCYACHGALKQESGLRVDTAAAMLQGGSSGPAIKAGAADSSDLFARITSRDPATRMPPEGKPLSDQQIDALRQWIEAGALHPDDEQPQADPLDHWSFRKLQRPALPPRIDRLAAPRFIDNPIDRFLDASAASLNVDPLPEATRAELLRRVTIDLLGLPPTREELHAFSKDDSPLAYEKLVDRLLERPEYGQRWGRHWMDVWRYSDWYGRRAVPDVMNSYPQIWRWRDWIVRSLNEDKGYDRMVMEMLAADELAPGDDTNVVATGFIVRNWYKWNYETWMKDCVEHTGKAFLGLTLNCAMCHDHKFDPITQEDYFRFRAFFEPLELRHERVEGEPDPGPFQKYVYAKSYGPIKSGAIRVFDEKLDAKTYMFRGGDARNRMEDRSPVDARPPVAFTPSSWKIEKVALPEQESYPGLKPFVRREELAKANTALDKASQRMADHQASLTKAEEALAQVTLQAAQPSSAASRPAAGQILAAERAAEEARLAHRMASAERDAAQAALHALRRRIAADDARYQSIGDSDELAQVAWLAEQRSTVLNAEHQCLLTEQALMVAQRNAADAAADKSAAAAKAVEAASQKLTAARTALDTARAKLAKAEKEYTPLSPKYPVESTGRRLALARWIASADNPLTARVAVNHIWLRHFGQPLVESVDNFGIQGKQPKHPALLDWLAMELIERHWSMKSLHRMIVTSAAYRRSSRTGSPHHPNFNKDRDNSSYWKFPIGRMEAEVVRDSVLACAGALDVSPGGPELELADWLVKPRRSMYFTQHGESQMLFLSTFDGANVCDCYRRTSTVLPSQALALSNSELLVHYGRMAAETLSAQLGPEAAPEQFVQAAFETVLGRPAQPEELKLSMNFLAAHTAEASATTDDHSHPKAEARSVAATKDSAKEPAKDSSPNTANSATKDKDATKGMRPPSSDPAMRARENLMMTLFNHNDFVTVR